MKKILPKMLRLISLILVILFAVLLIVDYFKVYPFGSAPFYVYVLVRTIEFLVPSSICFIVSKLFEKHTKNNN